jgi:hypothetical protein
MVNLLRLVSLGISQNLKGRGLSKNNFHIPRALSHIPFVHISYFIRKCDQSYSTSSLEIMYSTCMWVGAWIQATCYIAYSRWLVCLAHAASPLIYVRGLKSTAEKRGVGNLKWCRSCGTFFLLGGLYPGQYRQPIGRFLSCGIILGSPLLSWPILKNDIPARN